MKKVLYFHGGSGNKGCEAIVRCTINILGKKDITVMSNNPQEDRAAVLNKECEIERGNVNIKRHSILDLLIKGWFIVFKSMFFSYYILYRPLRKKNWSNTIAVSVGGDNYCYDGSASLLGKVNKKIKQSGGVSVLWGCSIEKDRIDDKLIKDIKRYDLITARESITYESLKNAGVENVYLYPDPAFTLPTQETGYDLKNTVGINISPYMFDCSSDREEMKKSVHELLDWILDETDMNILFISHVEKVKNSDTQIITQICREYLDNSKVRLLSATYNCMETKDVISRCRFFVGARTHATIAAYSSCVPTLVIGYSVKALGIAKDIWGKKENLVIDTRAMEKGGLLKKFQYMYENEKELREYLESFMPEYIKQAWEAGKLVQNYEE